MQDCLSEPAETGHAVVSAGNLPVEGAGRITVPQKSLGNR